MSRRIVELSRDMKDDYNYNESIKTLRTNILFCGSKVRTIMFTSSVPDEGKSDITFAAAQSMAQLGKRVLVIDADIRRSVLVSRYQLGERVNGLSQYLSGQKQLEEVIYDTNVENLSVIFAGPYSPNPSELLEEKLFTRLLEYGRSEFDYIMIDTPPMANLIDGAGKYGKYGKYKKYGKYGKYGYDREYDHRNDAARAKQDQIYKENVPAGASGKKKEGSREEVHS